MKASVYKDTLNSIFHQKKAISNFIKNISHAELIYVFASKIKWVDACLKTCGDHFQYLL
jgi:hypothetical protein